MMERSRSWLEARARKRPSHTSRRNAFKLHGVGILPSLLTTVSDLAVSSQPLKAEKLAIYLCVVEEIMDEGSSRASYLGMMVRGTGKGSKWSQF
jgi:hypothetical protein